MINITEFKIKAPDQEGDITQKTVVEVENTTNETIHQLRWETIFFGCDGDPILFDKETVEDELEQGRTATFSPWGYIKGSATKGSLNDVKIRSCVRLMKLDQIDFGLFDTPLVGEKSLNKSSLSSGLIESDALVNIVVRSPDEENGCAIEVKILVKSLSSVFYENAKARVSLFDKKTNEIDSNYCDDNISVCGNGMFEIHLYAKKSKLKDTKVSVKLDLYSEAAIETAEATSEGDND